LNPEPHPIFFENPFVEKVIKHAAGGFIVAPLKVGCTAVIKGTAVVWRTAADF